MNSNLSSLASCLLAAFIVVALAGCSGETSERMAVDSSDQTVSRQSTESPSETATTTDNSSNASDPVKTEGSGTDSRAAAEKEVPADDHATVRPSESELTDSTVPSDGDQDELPDLETAMAKSGSRAEMSTAESAAPTADLDSPSEIQTIQIPPTWKRLSQQQEVWLDMQQKQVIAAGHVCLNAGPLEMFICPRQTKEHESVIAVNALSSQIHAALLALGAEPGHPVKWEDEYQPAEGPVIEITVMWKDDQTDQIIERRAQEMVRNMVKDQIMTEPWVFGGSQVYTDPETGESFYYGDSGELVCLSNFSTATMDVPVKSSDANAGLLFAANTDRIPPVGTKVYVLFEPQLEKSDR